MKAFRPLALGALLATAFCCHAQQSVAVHAELRPDVLVEGRTVTLGDIAALTGAAPDTLAAMANRPVATSPQPGYTLHLTRREILRLLHEAGVQGVVLDGADSAVINTVSFALDMDAVAEAARQSLEAKLERDGRRIELTAAEMAHALRVPRGKLALRVRKPEAEQIRKRMTVNVDVMLDDVFYRTVPVTFQVSASEPVLVARKNLAKGAALDCEDLELQVREISALPSAPQDGDCAGIRLRLKRDLTAGEPLLAALTEPVPVIGEGQYVTLKIEQGAVLIESRALALADGRLGDKIAVRPATSGEQVQALVTGPGQVTFSGR